MPEYDNTNTGVLFINDRQREGHKDPDRNGSLNVDGVDYWLSGWLKEKNGKKFLSLSVKPKEAKPAPAKKPSPPPAQKPDPDLDPEDDF